jgi:hypothetical protein
MIRQIWRERVFNLLSTNEKNRAKDKNNVLKPFLNLKDISSESAFPVRSP